MIPYEVPHAPLSDLLGTLGQAGFDRSCPLAGHRRLRFSFFADEPNQGSEVGDRHQAEPRLAVIDFRRLMTVS